MRGAMLVNGRSECKTGRGPPSGVHKGGYGTVQAMDRPRPETNRAGTAPTPPTPPPASALAPVAASPDWQQHIGNNARPQWLADAHDAIDAAVAAAYGWSETSPTTTFFASCWRSTVAVEMRVSGSSHTDGSN